MKTKFKISLIVTGFLLGLVLIDQWDWVDTNVSTTNSTTGVDVIRKSAATELVSTQSVVRPATRWLPLIKFGETIHRCTYQGRSPNGAIFERIETTRTRLLVVGFCSTARYDELADKPFMQWQVNRINDRTVAKLRQ